MTLSPDQLAQRLEGVTATDIACIVRLNPFRAPIDVFLEKTGQRPPFDETVRSKWGHLLEKPIRDDYAQIHDVRVEVPGTIVHRTRRWQMATPDGIVYPYGSPTPLRGLEIKAHGRDAVWFGNLVYGDPGTDEVPPHELIQSMWNIDVTGLDRWDLVAFLDGAPIEYIIDRDDELIGMLVEAGEKFFVDHIKTGEPPPPDGSEAWDALLKRRWQKNSEDLISIDDQPEVMRTVLALRDARAAASDLEARCDTLTQQLKNVIKDKAGLTWRELGKKKPQNIMWKRSKASRHTNWIAVMSDMRQAAAMVASGRAAEFERARIVLSSLGAGASVGSSTRATMTAGELVVLLDSCLSTLTGIAKASTEVTHTTAREGNRPFLAPHGWRSLKTASTTEGN